MDFKNRLFVSIFVDKVNIYLSTIGDVCQLSPRYIYSVFRLVFSLEVKN